MASSINKISETTNHSRMRIPNLGWVRMRESLRFTGKLLSATVSRVADRWCVSLTADTEDSPKRRTENQGATGVDLGVSALATFSTGEKVVGPKPHKALLKRLKRLSRSLSRKHKAAKGKLGLVANAPIPKGVRLPVSENTKKARAELSRFHARIANIRADALHKLTSEVTRRVSYHRHRGLEWARHDGEPPSGPFHGRHGLLRVPATTGIQGRASRWTGRVVADRWFPSRKTGSDCGSVQKDMPLSLRQWMCPDCGASHDRDLNAARNLATYAASSAVSACGPAMRPAMPAMRPAMEEGAGSGRKTGVNRPR